MSTIVTFVYAGHYRCFHLCYVVIKVQRGVFEMSYLGAKGASGVHQAIINVMPPHTVFCELFGGTGVITRKKAPSIHTIFMDKAKKMIDEFNYAAAGDFSFVKKVGCAIEFLEGYTNSGLVKTLFYLDPPYMPETRTSSAKYDFELTPADHKRLLLAAINQARQGAYIIISGYDNALYKEMLKGWWNKEFQAMTRGGVRTEKIWCSFTPSEVHYHSFAGKNFTDRQRIKRKAESWANRFSKLPPAEKQAVLAAVLSVE